MISRQTLSLFGLVAISIFAVATSSLSAKPIEIAEIKHDGDVDFAKEVLPILRQKCLACHNRTEAESDLVLESPQAILKGGSEGPAAIAGKGADSLLLKAAAHQTDSVMPPEDNDVGAKPFTSAELGLLKLWIDQGAKGDLSSLAGPIEWQPLPAGVNPVYSVAVSHDGQIVAAGRANQVYLYHLASKRELGRLTDPKLLEDKMYDRPGVAHLDLVQAVAFSPDNQLLATAGYRTVKLWKRPKNTVVADIAGLAGVSCVAVSPNREQAVVGQANGEMKLIDLLSNKVIRTIKSHTGSVSGVAFSSDGQHLLSGGQDQAGKLFTAKLWNLSDGKQQGEAIETTGAITAVAVVGTTEQPLAATAEADNKIRIWNLHKEAAESKPEDEAKDGEAETKEAVKPVKEIAGHSGKINSLVVHPTDSNQLLSGSDDGTVRLWNVSAGNALKTLTHGGGPVTSVAFRPDGQRIASAGENKSIKLWNYANNALIVEMKGDYRDAVAVSEATRAVSLAKRMVAVAKKDLEEGNKRKTSEEANAKKAAEAKTKGEAEKKAKEEAAKKPLADKAAADKVAEEKQAALEKIEAERKPIEEQLAKANEELTAAEKDRDAKKDKEREAAEKVVVAKRTARDALTKKKQEVDGRFNKANSEVQQANNKVKQLTAPATKASDELAAAVRTLDAATRSVERSAVSVKKATDQIAPLTAEVKAAEEAQKKREAELVVSQKMVTDHQQPVRGLAFSPDGKLLASVGDDKIVHTWETETGKACAVYEGQDSPLKEVVFANNGNIVSFTDINARRFDTNASWQLASTIGGDESDAFVDRVTSLSFSPDSKLLATGGGEPSRSGELKIWNVENGALVREMKDAHSDTIFSVRFSPDGQYLATSGADRFMKTHRVADGTFVRSFEGHTHHVLGVAWSADGLTLASSGADNAVKIWDFRTGDQTRTITGFNKEVTGVRFVSDSTNIVASCGDKNVHMKRADNGGNVRTFGGAADYMYTVAASPDGKHVVAGGYDSVVRIWSDNGQVHANFEPPQVEAEEEK